MKLSDKKEKGLALYLSCECINSRMEGRRIDRPTLSVVFRVFVMTSSVNTRVPHLQHFFFSKSREHEKNKHLRKPLMTRQSRIKANIGHGKIETSSGRSVGGKTQRAFLILFRLA